MIAGTGRAVTNTRANNLWSHVLATTPDAPRFTVRVHGSGNGSNLCGIMMGYAKGRTFEADTGYGNHKGNGWYLSCLGHLRSDFGGERLNYSPKLKENDRISAEFNRESKTISFAVNDESCGTAFSHVDCSDGALFPSIALCSPGSSVSLEDCSI